MKDIINLNIELLKNANKKPYYASEKAAGLDISAATEKDIFLKHLEYKIISTGLKIEIPDGFEGQLRPRSGLAFNHGVTILNTPGTIDSDYRGEIKILLINLGKKTFKISPGMRIAQLVISSAEKVKINVVRKLNNLTERNDKGFGSTGL